MSDHRANARRRFPLHHLSACMVVLAVLAVAAQGCGGTASRDSSEVKDLLARQLSMAKAEDWQGLYDTYSPRYQDRCPYEAFLARASSGDAATLRSLSYGQVHIRIDGAMAFVTYVTTRDGQVVAAVTDASPDLYVKINGRWFDEYDELAFCS